MKNRKKKDRKKTNRDIYEKNSIHLAFMPLEFKKR